MLFSSIPFLYYFLPAVLLCYFLLPAVLKYTLAPVIPQLTAKLTGGRWQASSHGFLTSIRNFILLVFSLVFYGWGEPKYVYLMIATIALFYICGLAIGKCTATFWKRFCISAVPKVPAAAAIRNSFLFLQAMLRWKGRSSPVREIFPSISIFTAVRAARSPSTVCGRKL